MTYENTSHASKHREAVILAAIANNPNIHHNALQRIVVQEGGHMAKRTFERKLKELVDAKQVFVLEDGNKLVYSISDMSVIEKYEAGIVHYLDFMDKQIRMLEKTYAKLPLADKITISVILSQQLLGNINYLDLFMKLHPTPPIKKYEAIKDKYHKLLSRLLSITSKDSHWNIVNHFIITSTVYTGPLESSDMTNWLKSKQEQFRKRLKK